VSITSDDAVELDDSPRRSSYLDRREAADYCRVPVSTFDALRRRERIPHPDAEMGKHMLWKRSTLDDFLESGGTRDDQRR
jgi:excisionase family DNA binding protein